MITLTQGYYQSTYPRKLKIGNDLKAILACFKNNFSYLPH